MTIETVLLTGIGSVTGALVFIAKILWARSEKCESDRYELREEIETLKEQNGRASGTLAILGNCPGVGAEPCPFRRSTLTIPVQPVAVPPAPVAGIKAAAGV